MFTERFQQLQNGAARATIQLDTSKCAIGGGVTYSFSMLYTINWKVYSICKYTKLLQSVQFFFSLPTESIGIGLKKKSIIIRITRGTPARISHFVLPFFPGCPPSPNRGRRGEEEGACKILFVRLLCFSKNAPKTEKFQKKSTKKARPGGQACGRVWRRFRSGNRCGASGHRRYGARAC